MASVDIHNEMTIDTALTSQTIDSDTTTAGEIIDTEGFEAVEFVMLSGTLTDGAFLPLIQDGDDAALGDAAAVADAFLTNTEASAAFALADDDTAKRIGYVGKKRYVRLNIVSSATTDGGNLAAVAVKMAAHTKAVANN